MRAVLHAGCIVVKAWARTYLSKVHANGDNVHKRSVKRLCYVCLQGKGYIHEQVSLIRVLSAGGTCSLVTTKFRFLRKPGSHFNTPHSVPEMPENVRLC